MKEIKPVFIYHVVATKRWIVISSKYFDYSEEYTGWMKDELLGQECLVPHLDMMDKEFVFDNEQNALRKVAELYAEQLK